MLDNLKLTLSWLIGFIGAVAFVYFVEPIVHSGFVVGLIAVMLTLIIANLVYWAMDTWLP